MEKLRRAAQQNIRRASRKTQFYSALSPTVILPSFSVSKSLLNADMPTPAVLRRRVVEIDTIDPPGNSR